MWERARPQGPIARSLPPPCMNKQVSMPLARVDGLPVGLSLIGPPGSDESLLDLAERIAVATGGAD